MGHLVTVNMAQTLGQALTNQERYEEAVELLVEAREGYQDQGAAETFHGLSATFSLCYVLRQLDRSPDAEAILVSTLDDLRTKRGADNDFTFWVIGDYAKYLQAVGRISDALQLIRVAKPESWATDNIFPLYLMYVYGRVLKADNQLIEAQKWYERSLDVLRQIKDAGLITKTGIMVGIGEHDDEVLDVLHDIRDASEADIITIGQYLQPTRNHLPIDRWVTPAKFEDFKRAGLDMGFEVVESGPLVRSSYHAEEQAKRLRKRD